MRHLRGSGATRGARCGLRSRWRGGWRGRGLYGRGYAASRHEGLRGRATVAPVGPGVSNGMCDGHRTSRTRAAVNEVVRATLAKRALLQRHTCMEAVARLRGSRQGCEVRAMLAAPVRRHAAGYVGVRVGLARAATLKCAMSDRWWCLASVRAPRGSSGRPYVRARGGRTEAAPQGPPQRRAQQRGAWRHERSSPAMVCAEALRPPRATSHCGRRERRGCGNPPRGGASRSVWPEPATGELRPGRVPFPRTACRPCCGGQLFCTTPCQRSQKAGTGLGARQRDAPTSCLHSSRPHSLAALLTAGQLTDAG